MLDLMESYTLKVPLDFLPCAWCVRRCNDAMSVAFHESELLSVLVYSAVYCGPYQTPSERTNL